MTLRTANPERDFARIAELLSLISTEPVTVDGLLEDEARTMPGKHWRRWVWDDTGRIDGYAMVIKYPSQPADLFNLELVVDPAKRRQGTGTALLDAAFAYAREHQMGRLRTEVRDDSAESLRFAEKHGFAVSHHVFDSTLDVANFDEAPFSGVIEQVEASGIRFFTLADTGRSDDALRQLYELNRGAVLDEPGSTGGFPTYENWLRIVINAGWYRAENQFIAADGERFVGLAGVYAEPGMPETMFNGLTGVHRDTRRRGIALALKLLTIRRAKALGARVITTNNDERNAAMLAINRRLGYIASSGHYVVEYRSG
jgi:RimJ/RimL family protein N-acetyltransferase